MTIEQQYKAIRDQQRRSDRELDDRLRVPLTAGERLELYAIAASLATTATRVRNRLIGEL